jgi:hypothetical protein
MAKRSSSPTSSMTTVAFYRDAEIVKCDVTRPDIGRQDSVPIADDMVYNLSAKMLSPLQVRAKRHDFFYPVNYDGTKNIIEAMDKAGREPAGAFYHRHDLRPHQDVSDDRGSSGRAAWRIRPVETRHRGSGSRMARAGHVDLAVPSAADHRPWPARDPRETVQADRCQPAGSDDRVGQEPVPVHLGVRLRRSRTAGLEGGRSERGLQSRLRSTRRRCASCSATWSSMPVRNRS